MGSVSRPSQLLLTLLPISNTFTNLAPGFLNDMHSFDPTRMAWTLLTAAATDVSRHIAARNGHGFTSMRSKLYVHGGWNEDTGDGLASG